MHVNVPLLEARLARPSAPTPQPFLERWARLSYHHRWKIIGAWILALFAIVGANFVVGGTFVSEFSVPGTEAQKARDLLEANFPSRAGDDADLVFHAPGGVNSARDQRAHRGRDLSR